jgi:hypothetical protein
VNQRAVDGGGIETLVERVLMDAARDAEHDLESLLEEMRRLQAQRARLRALVQELGKESHELSDRLRSEFADVLDATTSDDEQASLRLQVALDRQAKLLSAISNVLKKLSDTDRQIVQNLK